MITDTRCFDRMVFTQTIHSSSFDDLLPTATELRKKKRKKEKEKERKDVAMDGLSFAEDNMQKRMAFSFDV